MQTNDFFSGGSREDDEEYQRRARNAHPPEYAETTGEVLDDQGDPWNPRIHLEMHAVVLRQLDEWDLAREVFEELTGEWDLHEHAAIHALGAVTIDIMYGMMQEPDDADSEKLAKGYREKHAEKLKQLVEPGTELHEQYVKPVPAGEPPEHPSV